MCLLSGEFQKMKICPPPLIIFCCFDRFRFRLTAEWNLASCRWWKKLDCLIKCQRHSNGGLDLRFPALPGRALPFTWSAVEDFIFFLIEILATVLWKRCQTLTSHPLYLHLLQLDYIVVTVWFTDNPEHISPPSLSALSSLGSAVLSCRVTVCSVEVMFLVMFMHSPSAATVLVYDWISRSERRI